MLSLLFITTSAWAADSIAMYGNPKYGPGFTQFDYVNPSAPKGGTFRSAQVGTFDTLNPFNIKGTPPPESGYSKLVFESLLYRSADEPFSLYPWLSQSVELPDDRSAITFHLNPAARWADGQPVTVDDVLFSWETLKAKGRPNMRSYYGRVAKAEIKDDVIKFTFQPKEDGPSGTTFDRELPLIIGLMPILPKHDWQGKVFDQTTLTPPLGSGAYRVESVDQGRKLVLSRRTDYWGRDLPVMRGMMNFDRIVLDYYRDETVARTAILSGAAEFKTESDLLQMQRAYKGKKDAVVTEAVPHHRPEPYRGFVFNTRRAPFDDLDLRKALAAASDFPQLNRTLYGGQLKRSLSSFANSDLAARGAEDATVAPAVFRARLKTAIDVLLAKGYRYDDQQLVTKVGKPVVFEILLTDSNDEKLALGWVRQLAAIGVTARVRTVDSAQFTARLNDFDYDVIVYRWINSLSPGNEQALYWGSAAAETKGSRNYAGVGDSAIDAAIDGLRQARDYGQLTSAAKTLDQRLIDGSYVIPLFYNGADLIAHSVHIKRPEIVPLTGYDLRTFWWE